MDSINARTTFMHNGEEVSLNAATLIGIDHDTHFDPDSDSRDTLVDAALKAEKYAL